MAAVAAVGAPVSSVSSGGRPSGMMKGAGTPGAGRSASGGLGVRSVGAAGCGVTFAATSGGSDAVPVSGAAEPDSVEFAVVLAAGVAGVVPGLAAVGWKSRGSSAATVALPAFCRNLALPEKYCMISAVAQIVRTVPSRAAAPGKPGAFAACR